MGMTLILREILGTSITSRVRAEVITDYLKKNPDVDAIDFEEFRKSVETTFISYETFTAYQKSQEKRLKSIEDRLGQGFCLVAINHYDQKRDKEYRSIFSSLKNLKNIEFEGLRPFLVTIGIVLLAFWVISLIRW